MSARGRRNRRLGLAVSVALAASSCGGDDGTDSAPASSPVAQRPTELTDEQIAAVLYAGSPRTPTGFYEETPPASYAYVNTAHLKNTDIADVASDAAQFELCTDDWNEAFNWSETAQQRASQNADLVATNDDPRYFEFARVRSGDPQVYLRGRVFKCAYVDRNANNLRSSASAAGTLKSTPITAQALQDFSEYVWQFTSYNNFGHVVLSSSGTSTATALTHTLLIANLERHAISSTCDRITVEAWRHMTVIATGELTRSVEELWSFGAREMNGTVERCD